MGPKPAVTGIVDCADGLSAASAAVLDGLTLDPFGLSPAPHAISTVAEKSALLLRVNPAYQDLVGQPLDRLLGTDLVGPIAIDDMARERRMHRLETAGSYASERAVIRHSSGRPIEVMICARRLRLKGEVFDIESFTDLSGLVEQHRRQLEKVEALAYGDAATGLLNRAGFEARLARHVASDGVHGFSVAVIAMRGLTAITEGYGHAVGDALLREVARRLQRAFAGQGAVARIGDVDFAVFIQGCSLPVADLEQQLFPLLCAAFAPVQAGHLDLSVGAVLGIAHAEEAPTSVRLLLSLADDRMHAAGSICQHVGMVGRTVAMGV